MNIESSVGKGTKITISLPLVVSDPPNVIDIAATNADYQFDDKHHVGNVLLVEDSEMVRKSTSKLLNTMGFYVVEASNGDQALNLLGSNNGYFDLLLTDIVMPGMRGRELAFKIKSRCPRIRVLLMSGFDDEMVDPDSEQANYPLVRKPFTKDQLADAINAVMPQ